MNETNKFSSLLLIIFLKNETKKGLVGFFFGFSHSKAAKLGIIKHFANENFLMDLERSGNKREGKESEIKVWMGSEKVEKL